MRRYRKQAGSSVGRRAQRGAVAMGMMAQSGRRSARVSERESPIQYGIPVCLDPNAINTYDGPMQGVELGALLFGGKLGGSNPCTQYACIAYPDQSVCDYGPSQGLSASGRQSAFRNQVMGKEELQQIPTCTMAGQALPDGAETMLNPQLSGCGVCRCQIPDGADCPDRIGQWMGGSIFNVDPSSCNCNFQSAGCVNPTGGGLIDSTISKLPRLRGKMRGQSGKMSRATQTGSGHIMRCGRPMGASSNHGWEYPEPTWGFTGCDYLFGTQSECQAQCTSGPSPEGDKMKNVSGRDMCGFYANSSDAPFTG